MCVCVVLFQNMLKETCGVNLSDSGRQHADDLLVWYGNNTLSVDVNDAVADPYAATLGYASSQQTANLDTQTLQLTNPI